MTAKSARAGRLQHRRDPKAWNAYMREWRKKKAAKIKAMKKRLEKLESANAE